MAFLLETIPGLNSFAYLMGPAHRQARSVGYSPEATRPRIRASRLRGVPVYSSLPTQPP